jgi:acylglycerol lipase
MEISTPKYYAIRALCAILPSITIQAGIDSAGMSHDKEEIQKYLDDPLVHDFATIATCKYLFIYI